MQQRMYKCTKSVGFGLKLSICNGLAHRHGKAGTGKQRYKCQSCKKTFTEDYINKSWDTPDNSIIVLLKEGCGIRSIGRLLSISKTTVQHRILLIAKSILKPPVSFYKTYEVDEMCTYYKNKGRLLWIVYALRRDTKTVADFTVGSRAKNDASKSNQHFGSQQRRKDLYI